MFCCMVTFHFCSQLITKDTCRNTKICLQRALLLLQVMNLWKRFFFLWLAIGIVMYLPYNKCNVLKPPIMLPCLNSKTVLIFSRKEIKEQDIKHCLKCHFTTQDRQDDKQWKKITVNLIVTTDSLNSHRIILLIHNHHGQPVVFCHTALIKWNLNWYTSIYEDTSLYMKHPLYYECHFLSSPILFHLLICFDCSNHSCCAPEKSIIRLW